VGDAFNAGAVNFNNLQSLTVNAGGAFETTGTIGSDAADSAGIEITVAAAKAPLPAGSVEVASIKKLRTAVIAGSLTTGSFTPLNAESTLSAAAGGTINGITFPAATLPITSVTSGNTVTIDDYTVPRNAILDLASGSILIIPPGKVLTFETFALAEGSGVIRAEGTTVGGTIKIDGAEGYTTTATGVEGDDFRTAVSALITDTGKLTNYLDLKPAFWNAGTGANYLGIGSIVLSNTTATPINVGADGTGTAFALSTGTTLDLTSTVPTIVILGGDTVGTAVAGDFTVEDNGTAIEVTDSGHNTSGDIYLILTVTPVVGTKLVNSELINAAAVPSFNIGVQTER
jgi:hypothetical protein